MIWPFLYVGLGGALGAMARYGITLLYPGPVSIFMVNVMGSFGIGVLLGRMTDTTQLLLITGVLGGFTTFSAFSLDLYKMIHQGQAQTALLYAFLSIGVSLLAVFCGIRLSP